MDYKTTKKLEDLLLKDDYKKVANEIFNYISNNRHQFESDGYEYRVNEAIDHLEKMISDIEYEIMNKEYDLDHVELNKWYD